MADRSDTVRVRGSGSQRTAEIVVGVDGSPLDQICLAHGLRLARALKMRLEAVTVWFDDSDTIIRPGESMQAEEHAAALLIAAGNHLFGDVWPDWFHVSSYQGDPIAVLINKSKDAEYVIVGGRDHVTFAEHLRPSISIECAERAHCPVIVTHQHSQGVVAS